MAFGSRVFAMAGLKLEKESADQLFWSNKVSQATRK
jgi:hypothetical protein